MPRMQRRARYRPIVMRAATAACLVALLSGCGIGGGFSGSGNGFGGFGGTRIAIPEAEANGYTMRRLKGSEDDRIGLLQPDPTIRWPDQSDENRPSVFETDAERAARERQQQSQQQNRRGSSSESPDLPRTQPQDLVRQAPAPRPLASPPAPEQRGQAIPGAPPGTVTTGGTGNSGTFGGPAGTGTTVRDGGTMTLMGADGQIRTVPAPR